jgi:hypothetical protein
LFVQFKAERKLGERFGDWATRALFSANSQSESDSAAG